MNEQTTETVWDFEEVRRRAGGGGGYAQQSSGYEQRSTGYGGGGYPQPPAVGYNPQYPSGGAHQTNFQPQQATQNRGQGSGGGHGLAYGAAGLVAGAALMYEGEKVRE